MIESGIEKFKKKLPFLIFLIFILGPMLGKYLFPLVIVIVLAYFLFKNINKKPAWSVFTNKHMSQTIDLDSLGAVKKVKQITITLVLLFFGFWLFFASIVIVDAGETGVYSLFGKVKDEELRSGFHLVIPLAKVTKMSIRTEEYTMSAVTGEGRIKGDDSIEALTKEGLKINLDITVLYRLNEDKASDVYKELGLGFDEKIIRPTIRTAIRDVIAQYDAKDVYSEKREEANKQIEEKVARELEPRGIAVEDVLLRNVALPENLAKSIQEKLQAEQEAQKYDFILQKEGKEKERKIIEAEGQRDAQKIINESLTSNYLYYLYVSDLKSREGTIYVPTNPSTGMPLFRDLGK